MNAQYELTVRRTAFSNMKANGANAIKIAKSMNKGNGCYVLTVTKNELFKSVHSFQSDGQIINAFKTAILEKAPKVYVVLRFDCSRLEGDLKQVSRLLEIDIEVIKI